MAHLKTKQILRLSYVEQRNFGRSWQKKDVHDGLQRSCSDWLFFFLLAFPALTCEFLSGFTEFLLWHLFVCASGSTAVLRETQLAQPALRAGPWVWGAQPLTRAGIPTVLEQGMSSGSGTADSALSALASWECTGGKCVPAWKMLLFCVTVSHCWVTLNLLPWLWFYTEWLWAHWHSLPAHCELLLESFTTCIKCGWDRSLYLKAFAILHSCNLLGFLNVLNCAVE